MSRGISSQQRCILALAHRFNVQLNGGTYRAPSVPAPAGERYKDGFRHLLLSESLAPPDFFPWMLEHYVGGVPFAQLQRNCYWLRRDLRRDAFYKRTADYCSAKASLRRAVSGLWNKGYLAYHEWKRQIPGCWSLANAIASGYILTPASIDIGAAVRSLSIGDAIGTVCGMLDQTRRGALWGNNGERDTVALRLRRFAGLPGSHASQGTPEVLPHRRPGDGVTINSDGSIEGKCYPSITGDTEVTLTAGRPA